MAVRRGKKIDFKRWEGIPSITLESSGEATALGGSLAFAIPATILRCRGNIMCSLDETKQVGDVMVVSFALGIISTDAFVAGVTAVPDPAGEIEYPWLFWGDVTLQAYVAAGEEAFGSSARFFDVDTKAMRKVSPGQSLAWIVQRSGSAGSPTTLIDIGQTRVLIGT